MEENKDWAALRDLYEKMPIGLKEDFIEQHLDDATDEAIIDAYHEIHPDADWDDYDDDGSGGDDDEEKLPDPRDYDDQFKCHILKDVLCAFDRANPRLPLSLADAHRIIDDAWKYMCWK